MADEKIYPVIEAARARTHIDAARYQELYARSLANPDAFWAEQADAFVTWSKRWDRVTNCDLRHGTIRWFEGARLNVSYNCLDRHLETRGDQTALIWESDDPNHGTTLSYRELHRLVCRFANALKARGVRKGDRVSIYLPMIPEAIVAMLACARIGAVHSVVFGGFSPEALKSRVLDADCRVVVTADEGVRGGKTIPLKANTDEALAACPEVHTVFVVRRTGGEVAWLEGRDLWYHDVCAAAAEVCVPEEVEAEDPLFILYTSGSTGKPKGVLHTSGGYLLFAAMTHKYVFDYHPGDIYWCGADVGWVTGHTYIVYGPLANGAVTLLFEGIPTHPDPSRAWHVIDKYGVNIFYTAPTVLRALMGMGDHHVTCTSRQSLRLLGSVGEPINPEAWEWYFHVVGEGRCPVVDTWWQTETGGILITPLPGARALKPGSATLPFFGIEPALMDEQGREIVGAGNGTLVIKRSWPGQMRTVFGDHQRFIATYLAQYPGYYFTGDGARRDADGYYWITGRVDDVINVSGHRLGTAEIESALVLHEAVSEAAVVGFPHDIKGQGIYAFVTLMHDVTPSEALRRELLEHVRKEIGAIAAPDYIQWASGLPKTRSGKIMRRILRKVAANEVDDLGDVSTLADPGVVNTLVAQREGR
ncbi:MAG: acetate--CoA ligase [Gammaproteobacteria bacterium]|nr:acetate--CoA ligase [Gammaproteobacteria bacterium]